MASDEILDQAPRAGDESDDPEPVRIRAPTLRDCTLARRAAAGETGAQPGAVGPLSATDSEV